MGLVRLQEMYIWSTGSFRVVIQLDSAMRISVGITKYSVQTSLIKQYIMPILEFRLRRLIVLREIGWSINWESYLLEDDRFFFA